MNKGTFSTQLSAYHLCPPQPSNGEEGREEGRQAGEVCQEPQAQEGGEASLPYPPHPTEAHPLWLNSVVSLDTSQRHAALRHAPAWRKQNMCVAALTLASKCVPKKV